LATKLLDWQKHVIPNNGVFVLHYADGAIMCLKESLEIAKNMEFLLYLYELMSEQRINFMKSMQM
jgi:hypothetical protein